MSNFEALTTKLTNVITNLDNAYAAPICWKIWSDAYDLRELIVSLKEDDPRTELVKSKAQQLQMLMEIAGVTHIAEEK